jgi:uncharacterized protein DUF2806
MTTNETGGGRALINFGDLSRPATVLIERISDAVGGIAKPWQIVRVATAEAEADTIRAHARIEISEMEERALIRMVREEGKKQENIENITTKAIPQLSEDANPENIKNDWLSRVFDRCRHVSDEDMQALWATIIAGEANNPGSFSTRAVDIVATLDKRDLGLIAEAAKFCISGKGYGQIIYRIPEYLFSKGLTFEKLIELENMGILSGVQVANLSFRYAFESHGNDNVVPLNYANKKVMVIHKNEKTDADHILTLPAYLITLTGAEILKLGNFDLDDDYLQECAKDITRLGNRRVCTGEILIQQGWWAFSNLIDV